MAVILANLNPYKQVKHFVCLQEIPVEKKEKSTQPSQPKNAVFLICSFDKSTIVVLHLSPI